MVEEYWLHGILHRENGPASIVYNADGSISAEVYYHKNKISNYKGPAVIYYNNGVTSSCYYYIDGISYEKPQWEKIILNKKINTL